MIIYIKNFKTYLRRKEKYQDEILVVGEVKIINLINKVRFKFINE